MVRGGKSINIYGKKTIIITTAAEFNLFIMFGSQRQEKGIKIRR